MKPLIIVLLCLLAETAHAQYLKIDNGIVISSFKNKKDIPLLSSSVNSYTVQLGLDYLERKSFSLSSQIGYIRIGGRETNELLLQPELKDITEKKEYIHINTTFRPHIKKGKSTLFLGLGPTINILTGNKKLQSIMYDGYQYNQLLIGGKAEIGITEDVKRFRLGLLGGYLLGFSPVAKSEFLSLYNNNISILATIGYRIK